MGCSGLFLELPAPSVPILVIPIVLVPINTWLLTSYVVGETRIGRIYPALQAGAQTTYATLPYKRPPKFITRVGGRAYRRDVFISVGYRYRLWRPGR